jgi:hypothetical protein
MRMSLKALCCGLVCCVACGPKPSQRAPALGTTRQALLSGEALWEQKTIASPPARMAHALIYDAARGVTIAAGGRPVTDLGASLSDTWAWDGQSWASIAAGLPRRGFITGTFDSARGISLTYGGLDVPTTTRQHFSEIIERGAAGWIRRSGFPGLRSGAGLAYDATRAFTVLFGGFDGAARSNRVWEWDGAGWSERCAAEPCNLMRPSVREDFVFVFDAERQVTLLFGGLGDTGALADTWTWNGSTWSQRLPAVSPSPRHGCAAAYDPSTRRVIVFGGVVEGAESNELWAWDGTTWEQVAQTSGPGPRRDVRLAWDAARRRGVLFGGRSGTNAVDFWELSLVANTCTSDTECHSDSCIQGICGGPPPAPEVDSGAGGAGGVGGALPDSGAPSQGGSADGGTTSSGSSDAGNSPPAPGAEPAPPADETPPPVLPRAKGATSFYACSAVRGSNPSSSSWFVMMLALFGYRRRRSGAHAVCDTRADRA